MKTYATPKDIIVQEHQDPKEGTWWLKSLLLDDNFAISASIHREARLDGFGLAIYRREDRNGYSWEWFDRDTDQIFSKRQGPGRVSVTIADARGQREVTQIKFLDDVVLRYLDDMSKPPGVHTHEVLVKKGSILKVAP